MLKVLGKNKFYINLNIIIFLILIIFNTNFFIK
jgi:hypothetical protein